MFVLSIGNQGACVLSMAAVWTINNQGKEQVRTRGMQPNSGCWLFRMKNYCEALTLKGSTANTS
jgi:hypothetical protein